MSVPSASLRLGLPVATIMPSITFAQKHVEITVAKSALSLVEHLERFGLIRFYSGQRFHQRRSSFVGSAAGLLSGSRRREYNNCGGDRDDHEFSDHSIPPVASSDERGPYTPISRPWLIRSEAARAFNLMSITQPKRSPYQV